MGKNYTVIVKYKTKIPKRYKLYVDRVIGQWYLKWKDDIVDWERQEQKFMIAKEDLKYMIEEA